MPIAFAKHDGTGGFDSHADRAVRIHIDGSAVGDTDYLLHVNNWVEMIAFSPPAPDAGKRWVRVIDTAAWAESHDNIWSEADAATIAGSYGVHPWSVAVFQAVAQ